MRIALFGPLFAAATLAAAPAVAQDSPDPQQTGETAPDAPPPAVAEAAEEGKARLSIGAGVAYFPDYEGSNEHTWSPIPAAQGTVAGMSFTLLANRVSLDLIPNDTGPGWDFQLGPVAVLNLNRTKVSAIEDPRIVALGEVDTALEVGGYVGIGKTGVITSDFDKLSVTLSYRHDVTKIHKSGIWTPAINYMTPLSTKALVGLFATAEIVEDDYARTYFGVTPAGSAASGLPVFTPKGGQKNIAFGGMFTYALTGDLTKGLALVTGFNYSKLLGDFADSPLVSIAGSRHQWTFGAGLALTF
ncbi:MipA/OmpV family protein [Sphingomonas sp.]|uniref:MipA/OmpV family protein n=1 Tax=Sphingomonas sp. TaxID=28214 RepID=UPI002EDB01AE